MYSKSAVGREARNLEEQHSCSLFSTLGRRWRKKGEEKTEKLEKNTGSWVLQGTRVKEMRNLHSLLSWYFFSFVIVEIFSIYCCGYFLNPVIYHVKELHLWVQFCMWFWFSLAYINYYCLLGIHSCTNLFGSIILLAHMTT